MVSANPFLTQEQLIECFTQVGFEVSGEEVLQIFKDFGAHKHGYLDTQAFLCRLTVWQDEKVRERAQERFAAEDPDLEKLRDQAEKLAARGQQRQNSMKRPMTATAKSAISMRDFGKSSSQKP